MCTNPLRGFKTDSGSIVKITKSDVVAVRWNDFKQVFEKFYDDKSIPDGAITSYTDIPCRSCLECYNQIRKEWIWRAVAESQCHDKMIFLTLTYNDDKIPVADMVDDDGCIWKHPTLQYSDFQKFMKRLRKYVNKPIRFMVCGEYGSHTYRPHYHAIIFGVGIDDFNGLSVHSQNSHGDILYTCEDLEFLWRNGYVICSAASVATIAYVAGYVAKKSTSVNSKLFYKTTGCVPPFIKSSNRPGLGSVWFADNIDDFINVYDYKSVATDNEPVKLKLTSNWKKIYEREKILRPICEEQLTDDFNGDKITIGKISRYCSEKDLRRQELFDDSFSHLDTDMTKEDFNNARNIDLRNSSKRKRGVY